MASLEREPKGELMHHVAVLRERYELLAAESARECARAQALTAHARRSREERWLRRFDQAFGRHDRQLRDVGLDSDEKT